MKGKWAQGIVPRNFAWVIRDQLAVSERPGGYGVNHRRVRRQEEIIWIREQGFSRVVSLLSSPHNLHHYDELGVAYDHLPFPSGEEMGPALGQLYGHLRQRMAEGEKLLVHHDDLGDRLAGAMAGYLVWAALVPQPPQAVAVMEQILHRRIGPPGRELVSLATALR